MKHTNYDNLLFAGNYPDLLDMCHRLMLRALTAQDDISKSTPVVSTA